jgi:hypothetical protein
VPLTPRRLEAVCAVVALAWCVLLAGLVVARMRFPRDYFIGPEPPLPTNLWKIDRALPLCGDAGDVTSFIYPPRLGHLCCALPKPLGRRLEVRRCRTVVVLPGLFAAAGLAVLGRRVSEDVRGARLSRPRFSLPALLATLLPFKSATADRVHANILRLFHLALTAPMGRAAPGRRSFGLAAAVAVGALGVGAKQTAGATALGVGVGLARLTMVLVRSGRPAGPREPASSAVELRCDDATGRAGDEATIPQGLLR